MSLWVELKRRNVVRVGVAYALIAWVALQAVDFLVEVIDAPAWVLQIFVIAAAIGLVGVLVFAWVFEMTPEGIKRESEVDRTQSITPDTGRKLDRLIIVFLAVAVVFLLAERFWHPAAESGSETGSASVSEDNVADPIAPPAAGKKSLAVLPFVAFSDGPDDEYFADGLTEEILNALAQLPELLVTARTSAFSFKGQDVPVQEIAAALGVDHVVEGSVRRSGDRLRVTAQLVRAADGFHLWSENYDSTDEDAIQVQEDIALQIARVLDVILDEGRREAMRQAGLRDVEAFIAFQKGTAEYASAHGERDQVTALMKANRHFERVLERVPDYPPALVMHADAYVHLVTSDPLGELEEDTGPLDAQAAYRIAVEDYTLAIEHSRSFEERTSTEFDLVAVTGQFTGIRGRIEAVLAGSGCTDAVWVDQLAMHFGYVTSLREYLDRVIACDPLQVTNHFSAARAALWDGDAEAALAIIQATRDASMSHNWMDLLAFFSHLALGQFETAASETALRIQNRSDTLYTSAILAAARGDREGSEAAFQREIAMSPTGNFSAIQHYAQVGDRETANRLAAEVDARALSPIPLLTVISWCMCGAPFDLEATPGFAARLAEGDLPWPPATVIDFPLKDW